ncbi:hypothetical protein [Flavihumibacter sp. CACIAM 22H1]|uniref:hypothetical protein n=1 Tax=Flavihumibacter sp. CACIAM 22H1 TaxID=1812911 RepID=UPI0007A831F4|nr:hypothetical protein [Flavihumibacter sp. CACIAM 22H1]KYP16546.1 MAG: hypothetical protein A1D16_13490 [Flavihumibacter sp. CACIAM 22H1]
MQVIKRLLYTACLSFPVLGFSQSTLLPQGYKHQPLMDRMEIMYRDSALSFQHLKPFDRRGWVRFLETLPAEQLSRVDQSNLHSALMNNSEWVTGDKSSFQSKKALFKTFYNQPSDFALVDVKDFFLSINPVVQFTVMKESDNSESLFQNTKGARGRGMIAKRIGFDFYLTDNQERPPSFVKDFIRDNRAVPGAGYYKTFKSTAFDYFDARGSVFFNVTDYINMQFGYDRNFIGNGYRSMFLSDFGNNNLFLKINTRIWKLNYQNLFMELNPSHIRRGDNLLDKKYVTMHHLSWQATRWLNIGFFESVVFGRANRFDFSYLNPIIFYRSIEQQNGSPDNANVGLDLKANIAKRIQLYGQLLFDEFKLSEIKGGNGWWGNKYGLQLGGKYVDVAGIKNLDIQGELNIVRPFTYSFRDSVGSYMHYNQPLAHPRGANFVEFVGIARYQPHPKLTLQGKLIAWKQGLDSAGINFGSRIGRLYTTRPFDYGWQIGEGRASTGINASLWVGYELKENLFLDGSLMLRKLDVPDDASLTRNSTIFSLGLRMNMFRREYDY